MSFGIIVRQTKRMSFKPHMNHALSGFYWTKNDYLRDMKRQNCEPYNPQSVQKRKSKSYSPSKELREMASEIDRRKDKDGNFEMSGAMQEFMHTHKEGNVKIPKHTNINDLNIKEGGFNASDKKR